jgi:predicted nuclease of restriction endonuclease-like RecB superfamily
MTSKHKANRSIYDGYYWDSDLELDFYKRLTKGVNYVSSEVVLRVKPSILVKPPALVFPARRWKCDFQLQHSSKHINIEVKGFLTRDFMMMFEMFEYCNPREFEQTYIVSGNDDVRRKYVKLGSRFIWLPDATYHFINPSNW